MASSFKIDKLNLFLCAHIKELEAIASKSEVEAAYSSGCRRFDGAIKGYGGCPMAKDDLVGNMPTEKLISFTQENKIETAINTLAFESAYNKAIDTF